MSKNSNYLFCSAKTRPVYCLKESVNLCCYNCDENEACQLKNFGQKIKPCSHKNVLPDEICEYMI